MNILPLCSVAEVKAIVSPQTVTDEEISSIVSHASNLISLQSGASTDASDNLMLNMAGIHSSVAFVLQKMKYSGELAQQYVLKGHSQSNNIDAEIKYHQTQAASFVSQYLGSTSQYKILYGRVGPRTIDSEAVH